jgi:NAD(P)H-hydrate epimerase
VAAEWLLRRGTPVDLVLAPRHAVSTAELGRLQALGGGVVPSVDGREVQSALGRAGVAVDALAGIGARGALREPLATLARQLNAARGGLHVVALDLPSGMDADTGAVPGEAVWADTTVTLGGVKQGLLRFPAAERVGHLVGREIGIPETAERELQYAVVDETVLRSLIPARPPDAHKYRFGRALIVAGSDHFLGAPVLCSGAAARVGAGLITVASTRDVRLNVAAHLAEVTFTEQDVRASDGASAARALERYLNSHQSVVLGPGLGRGPATTEFVAEVLRPRPGNHRLVIDADGLFALSELGDWSARLGRDDVLTPHSGELERLVGQELSADEPLWVHAGRLARQWGCVLVAKGPFTCVAASTGQVEVWPRANPALATGGTGDVLAGIIGGLLAQGVATWDAARLGVGVHALAAERLVQNRHWRTLLASDLLEYLPAVLHELGSQPRSEAKEFWGAARRPRRPNNTPAYTREGLFVSRPG